MARTKVDVLLATPLYNVPMRLMVTVVKFSNEKVLKKYHCDLLLGKEMAISTKVNLFPWKSAEKIPWMSTIDINDFYRFQP
jgi:hypothetical protein